MAWKSSSFLPGSVVLSVTPGNLPTSLQPCEELRARQRQSQRMKGMKALSPCIFQARSCLTSAALIGWVY